MAKKDLDTIYYVIILNEGQYEARGAENWKEAHDRLKYFSEKSWIITFGIYDPDDGQMIWIADEIVRQKYSDRVQEFIDNYKWE